MCQAERFIVIASNAATMQSTVFVAELDCFAELVIWPAIGEGPGIHNHDERRWISDSPLRRDPE
jgi:hypothetical protein